MLLFQVVDILPRDHIDLAVPFRIFSHHGAISKKLSDGKIPKVFLYLFYLFYHFFFYFYGTCSETGTFSCSKISKHKVTNLF